MFISYGIPEELSTDRRPQFISTAFQNFLAKWGVTHRLSSVAYPQSSSRTELGVKTAKRIINDVSYQGGISKYLFSDKINVHKIKTDKLQCYDKNWQTRFH